MRKEGAQSLWIDEALPKSDLQVKYEFDYLKKYFESQEKGVQIWAYKLIFVREDVTTLKKINYKKIAFLSCSVIINYLSGKKSQSYLLYSVASIPKKYFFEYKDPIPLMNYYFHSFKEYKFNFIDHRREKVKFKICGAPFFQKNEATSFCMQSAMATIFNNLSKNDALILPNQINEMFGVPVGSNLSFDKEKALKVISRKKFHSTQIAFDQDTTIDLFKFFFERFGWPPASSVYPWMESGFPGFIVFHTKSKFLHVVPIIGHTLNTDSWQPEADIRYSRKVKFHFRPVSAWVDNLIVHDDNFGMYFCYPTSKLSEKKDRSRFLIDHVIFITKDTIKLHPDVLEIELLSNIRTWVTKNKDVSEHDNIWLYKIINERKAPLVSRTLFIDSNDYIRHLREKDAEKKKIPEYIIKVIKKQLPSSFWLTEITLPDLYIANRAALISIITEKDANKQIFIRFPRFCYLCVEDEYIKVDLPTGSHFKLFERHNDIPTYDW